MGWIGDLNAAVTLLEKLKKKISSFWDRNNDESFCDDYYYQEYNKKIYVKKNGDGVIVSSFILKVIDPLKVDGLVRSLDIHDAKASSEFEDFEEMKSKSIDCVFSEFGFWYRSDNDIVTDVVEYYDVQDISKKKDPKFISIKLIIDTTKLEPGRTYRMALAYSIPGLFPIDGGRFDLASQDRSQYESFQSHASAEHMGHHLRFSAYFEAGIEFKEKPKGYAVPSQAIKARKKKNAPKTYNCTYKNNVFYDKYHFEVENPQEYTAIYMKWNLKNPPQKKAVAESEESMDKEAGN